MGLTDCAGLTDAKLWSMVDAQATEQGMNLSEMGFKSFDDISEQNVFNAVNSMMDGAMTNNGIATFDDITEENLLKLLEDNGVDLTDDIKAEISTVFPQIKAGAMEARKQANIALIALGLAEDEPVDNSGAYTMMASMAAVATAVVTLAF